MSKKYIVSMIVVAIIAISNVGTANAFVLGQTGQDVADLQIELIEAGFDIPLITSGAATVGYFGKQTQAALKAYEASKVSSPVLGAVTGPNSFFEYYNSNGVISAPRNVKFNQATTTICSIKSPYATSTLVFASAKFSVSSTTASIVDFAKSVNTGATTTKIGTTYSIAANAQATIVASTSPAAGDAIIFPPNNYLVVNMKGGANNVFSPTGACNAVWNVN